MSKDSKKPKIETPLFFDDPNIRVGRLSDNEVSENVNSSSLGFSFENLKEDGGKRFVLQEDSLQPQTPVYNIPLQFPYYQMVTFENQIRQAANLSEQAQYSFENSVGRTYAKLIEEVGRDKLRENTSISNQMTDIGYLRGKSFADGTASYHTIAEAHIVEGRKWRIGTAEYFCLRVQNIRTGKIQDTPLLDIKYLETDKRVEWLLSKYFFPSDSRAYLKNSIKDLRSRIYEFLNSLELETLDMHVGWKQSEYYKYTDGRMHPFKEDIMASFRKPQSEEDVNGNQIISELCEVLSCVDYDNRIRFLIIYALVAVFSSVCTQNLKNQPGILITGEQAVCRRYAEHGMKFYCREQGSDILDLQELSEKSLAEYTDVIRDDSLVIDCYDTTKKLRLVKAVASGRTVLNQRILSPSVLLQRSFNPEIEFSEFIEVDLYGFSCPLNFEENMEKLKALLIKTMETSKIADLLAKKESVQSFTDAIDAVIRFIRIVLIQAGVKPLLAESFMKDLEKGVYVLNKQAKRGRELPILIFRQRLRKLIYEGEIRVFDFAKNGGADDMERAIWVRNETAYIPAKYLLKGILPLMDMESKDFKVVRDILISKDILRVYNTEKGYTKDVTLPNGKRVSAYEIDYRYIFDVDELEEG